MENFIGKKALVVGGSGGIGAAASKILVELGASLFVHGGHDSPKFQSLIKELEDLAKSKKNNISVSSIIQKITEENIFQIDSTVLGKCLTETDILFVCFGPFVQKKLQDTTTTDWIKMALLDYALPGICVSKVIPNMLKHNWGRIILMGGTRTYSINGFLTNPAYAGAKTGISSLVKSVAMAYGNYGITCNAICPGFVATEYQSSEEKAALEKKMPSGKLISPDKIASVMGMLIDSPEINGAVLPVDSGWQGAINIASVSQ